MLLEIAILGATLALAAGASGAEAHRRRMASRVLERYARARGQKFVPAPKSSRRASPRVEGAHDGVDFVVDFYSGGEQIRTRVSALLTARVPKFSIVQRGAFSRTVSAGEAERATGLPAFDRAYRITDATAEQVERVAREIATSLLLLDDRRDVCLSADGAKVALSWAGIEDSAVLLDAARDAVVAVAAWRSTEIPYR